jgi:hypothetical protein
MSPDPTPLMTAACRKREHARTRAQQALRELDQQGRPITFQAVARHAGVSRQWLYQQPELREEIERLRDRNLADTRPRVADAHRASTASLHQRNRLLLAENRRATATVTAEGRTELK